MSMRTIEKWARQHISIQTRNRLGLYRVEARSMVSPAFALPSFIVIGTQRGGTSALYKYLSAHPDLRPSVRKEVQYFTRYYHKGLGWYRSNFAVRSRQGLSFEATPDYLFHPRAPERASVTFSGRDVRFVVLLRNPLDRAVSQYFHLRRLGIEQRSLDDALLDPESVEPVTDIVDDSDRAVFDRSYVGRSYYDRQLAKWFATFPRDRFLVLQSEHFFAQTEAVLRDVCRFVGVEEIPGLTTVYDPPMNPVKDISATTRAAIADLLRPVASNLRGLGVEMDWDL